MMKLTLSLFLAAFCVAPAAAGGGSFFGPGGGGGSSSTGTLVDGANASFNRVVADQLVSTGTAPSLTATGGVFTGSVTLVGTNGLSVGGNLGIGTASPSKKLHLSSGTLMVDGSGGDISLNGIVFTESGGKLGIGDSTPGFYLTAAPGTGARLGLYNAAPIHVGFGIDVSASNAFDILAHGSGAAGYINFGQWGTGSDPTSGTASFGVWKAAGLGIGTASPTSKLHVVGDTALVGVTTVSGSSLTVNSGATTDIYAPAGVRTPLILGGASYSGSTPYVAPGATHLEFNVPTAGTIYFYNQGNEKLSMSGTRLTASIPVKNYARTKAELLAITPAVGDIYYCSDCSDPTSSKATVVIGTAAVQGAFGTLPVGAFQ